MGKQLSRALETRHSVSGTHFKNARVARRVARAGLTTGGSSGDTMDDLRLKLFLCHLSWPLFLLLSLDLWILALRSDIPFSYPPHPRSGSPYPISRRPPQSPKPVHTSHLYPAIPLSRHTYILYSTHHAYVDSLLHSLFFF